MNKLFKFAQAKGKWHKFTSFNLGGGAKLYKNFAQKLLAVSLCMAMVLLGVPRGGGGHVSEAAEEEGTVLSVIVDSGPAQSHSVSWSAFDVSSHPSLSAFYSDGSYPTGLSTDASGATDSFLVLPYGAHSAGCLCPSSSYWCYDSYRAEDKGEVITLFDILPRCVGCWSRSGQLFVSTQDGLGAYLSPFPQLPSSLLLRSSVALASSVGSSSSWSPGVDVAHCDGCAVTLVAPDGAPVAVSGTYDDGWTITRSASGEAVLDLLVGDFKVGEVTVTEAAGTEPDSTPDTTPDTTPAAPPADTPADSSYLETTVTVKGKTQRLRVYDTNKILPAGAQLKAEAVTRHEHMDDDGREVEHLLSYNISLLDANGASLPMPLTNSVELCFEVLDFLDEDELDVVLVQQFNDREFNETRVERDGARWVLINTDHFSPYALIDELSDAEKAALGNGKNNVKTGDHAVQVAVAGLGSILVLALGVMLRLITGKKKFEE